MTLSQSLPFLILRSLVRFVVAVVWVDSDCSAGGGISGESEGGEEGRTGEGFFGTVGAGRLQRWTGSDARGMIRVEGRTSFSKP
jgi:hypothetical protein